MRLLALILLGTSLASAQGIAPFVLPVPIYRQPLTMEVVDSSSYSGTDLSYTFQQVVTSTANRYTLVGIGDYSTTLSPIDSVKVDGAGGGLLDSLAGMDPAYSERVWIFGLKNIEAGTRTFTVYFKAGTKYAGTIVATFAGVNQTTPIHDNNSVLDTSSPWTLSITNDADEWTVDCIYNVGAGTSLAQDASQTFLARYVYISTFVIGMSYRSATGSSMIWTGTGSETSKHAAVVLNRTP